MWDGIVYECVQDHTAQEGWTPDLTAPTLWLVVWNPGDPWTPWAEYHAGDQVEHQGVLYECIQSHVSQPGWTPPVVPALWSLVI